MDSSYVVLVRIFYLLLLIEYIRSHNFGPKRIFTTRSPRLYAPNRDPRPTSHLSTLSFSQFYENYEQNHPLLSSSSMFGPTTFPPRPPRNSLSIPYEPPTNANSFSTTESKRIIQFGHKPTSMSPLQHLRTPHAPQFQIETTNRPHNTQSQLKSYIKDILKIESLNDTLDQIISHSFNLVATDPTYVFLLPGNTRNETLVLHKSNFNQPVFPSISQIQRHIMHSNISKLYNLIENIEKIKPQPARRRPLNQQPTSFPLPPVRSYPLERPGEDLEEAESNRVVDENVRTERNFLRYMKYLNGHHDDSSEPYQFNDLSISEEEGLYRSPVGLQHIPTRPSSGSSWRPKNPFQDDFSQIEYGITSTFTTPSSINSDAWKELGLDGWAGGIKQPGHQFSQISSKYHVPFTTESSRPTSFYASHNPTHPFGHHTDTPFRPSQPELPDESSEHIKYTRPYSPEPTYGGRYDSPQYPTEANAVTHSQLDVWDVPGQHHEVPPQLSELLSLEYYRTHQNTSDTADRNQVPRWPVTSSRASHSDDDVFIGRANNPFGHSTKWRLKNLTSGSESEKRTKRGALLLYSMVKCSTGCDPLVYKGYGCYCGFLGSGRALDGIDRCCKTHDYCYEKANCPMFLEYFVPYLWKCYRGRPLCAIDHGEWGGPGSCASRLCECDQSLSKCLRRFYCPRKRAVCTSSPWRLLQNVIML